ncbi:transcriptional regulator CynR [Alcaligenes endophyticus]|uniref:Transcriptional regulator CynR n=1 Tax=Alcaligenes endophyticus TaxID=1929088 RepID=A0ABT8EGR7_9BURK|nr:transcriptional regulator CynR [Alcaligenes endophyticus]MCX5589856.1 transcriptional regulator CynR [Alcaligenes endophyticus]MDN4120481.1 transcriptional regulator CynR [Alcaligenes endophyticus]
MLLRHLHYFQAVAQYNSFTRAAKALHVSQPALSQQIRQLEEHLGAQLFDRQGRTVRLTDAGEVYLRYARQALQDLEAGRRALHDVSDLSRGSLRIAVAPTFASYLLGPLVEAFYRRYPNVTLTIQEMLQERVETQLLEDELDIGIAFDRPTSNAVQFRPLLVETLALVVNRTHALAERKTIDRSALEQESLVLLTREFATRRQIDRYCHEHDLALHVQMESNSLNAITEVVRRTGLSTLLPAAIAANNEYLLALNLEPAAPQRSAILMQRKGAYQSAAMSAFIELALKHGAAS